MNRERVDVKSFHGGRLEPLGGFNQEKRGWDMNVSFRCLKRVRRKCIKPFP